ncbi:phosphorylase family protein [Streptomyces sp. SAS_276]|uniref:phosphorylase family protein n=1 Tax=Streptomyces sp. SAS_276 TaxID=3412745 RepID=UPI00403C84A4
MVDVLIITALPMEVEAARSAGLAPIAGGVGIARWEERGAGTREPHLLGEYVGPDGISLSVALALSPRMGGRTIAPFTLGLVERLKPRCLAMSGVCAGNPARAALGDVVVAEMVYAHDEGKQTAERFQGDHRQIAQDERVIRATWALDTSKLPSFVAATDQDAKRWFLELLFLEQDPKNHPARERYFPRGKWRDQLDAFERQGLITRQDAGCTLTELGRSFIMRAIYDDADGPDRLPFGLVVGPMATGNAVVQDSTTWERLGGMGVRTITGLEMEAATIATIAETQQIPFWLVAKGVMDHADPNKRDHYKDFAAKASAEVLYALLCKLAGTITAERANDGQKEGSDWRTRLRKQGLHVWTDELFAAGMATSDAADMLPPLRQNEAVDAALLGTGRLPNLQREFAGVGRAFDTWIGHTHRKHGADGLRVFWLVGEAGPHRSKALLAAVSRAQADGCTVYDPGRNLALAAATIAELGVADLPAGPTLIAVDLPAQQSSADWIRLLEVLDGVRRYRNTQKNPPPVLVIGGTAAQEQLAYSILESSIEIESFDVLGRPHQRPYSYAGAESMASHSLPPEHIFNRGLPKTAPQLFGRGGELAALRDAWLSDETRILSVVAPGGVGKSALVNHWLREMRNHDYLGAKRLLAWSFYSQGTKENLVSADAFIAFALNWLGDDAPRSMSPSAQGTRLAKLIREHHFLLVLDGLEPLQHPEAAPDVGGMLTDSSIAALLRELAKPGWDGLCLITTRVPLTDLAPQRQSAPNAVAQLRLDNLDDRAGADLLQSLIGRQRDVAETERAVREVHGHALAVNLLGRYLRDVHGGQLSGRFELRGLTVAVADGGHARRIMQTYTEWLNRYGRSGELAILDIIGLFDRPAPYSAMAAVLADTELGTVAPGLGEVGSAEWDRCVAELRRMGLLSSETAGLPGTLDAHPLIREHFRDRLQDTPNDLWKAGNRALYAYYLRRAPELPSTAADMNLLYAAVNHGCAIGLHQEVFDTVLLPRVWRGPRASYSTRILGMTGSEIVALSNYFWMPRWTELRRQDPPLSQQARLMVMTNAGLRLRQLGRLDDARDSCGAVFHHDSSADEPAVLPDISLSGDDPAVMADAAFTAALYCELLVIAGQLQTPAPGAHDSARSSADRAIAFADLCGDPYFKMYSRSCLAEVYFMAGKIRRARDLFTEAEAIAAEQAAKPPFLYSQNLYRYGYFAIETGGAATLLANAEHDPGWGLNGDDSSQLSRAIRRLVLGAARRSLVEQGALDREQLATAGAQVDDAIVDLRGVGYTDYIVRGLLERAHLLRIRGNPEDYASALDDLDEALIETTRGSMKLLTADVYLQQAACHLSAWPSMTFDQRPAMRTHLADTLTEADQRVWDLGYGRRDTMLDELKQQARSYGVI